MSKFNKGTAVVDNRRFARGPVEVDREAPRTRTHEGAPAFTRTTKSDLFMLGVSNLVGEDTFYESAADRDRRFAELVRTVAVADVAWLIGFVRWLRREVGLRSAPLVAAAEGVHARRLAGLEGDNRALVAAAIKRADEPGEMLGYWRSHFGRALPKPVKFGVADALVQVYNEWSALKYDTPTSGYRFGDVIEAVHPTPRDAEQAALFEHLIARRRNRAELFRGGELPMMRARRELYAMPAGDRRRALADSFHLFKQAGLTWEAVPAWLNGPMDAPAWEAIIPHMPLFALVRNLRNFEEAGISDRWAQYVAERLSDADQVRHSGILPFQWWAAVEHAPGVRYTLALDRALTASTANIPEVQGDSLVLVDTSASMTNRAYSAKSKMKPITTAAIFGAALAMRNMGRVDLVGFASGTFEQKVRKGDALVKTIEALHQRVGEVGHGTEIAGSIRERLRPNHRRVFVISDMQTMDGTYGHGVGHVVPAGVALYGVNLGGYRPTPIRSGDELRIEFPAITDATFKLIPLIEAGRSATWPWEAQGA